MAILACGVWIKDFIARWRRVLEVDCEVFLVFGAWKASKLT